jgi:hypothetical protein
MKFYQSLFASALVASAVAFLTIDPFKVKDILKTKISSDWAALFLIVEFPGRTMVHFMESLRTGMICPFRLR